MIAVRLREFNRKKRFLLRTYVSACQKVRYKAGANGIPSNWRFVSDEAELSELRSIEQFELREVEDADELEKLTQEEMEQAIRMGELPVKAKIENKPKPKRDLSALRGKVEEEFGDVEDEVKKDEDEDDEEKDENLPKKKGRKKSKK